MKTFLVALALASSPVLAHDMPKNHAKHGEHRDAPTSFEKQPAAGT